MKTITVAQVLNQELWNAKGECPDLAEYNIYVLRDKKFVLYVGQTQQHMLVRLEQHLGMSWCAPSQIADLVDGNRSASLHWCFDLMTLDDCSLIALEQLGETLGSSINARGYEIALAERALIAKYRPPLNASSNARPRKLPKKYRAYEAKIWKQLQMVHRRIFK